LTCGNRQRDIPSPFCHTAIAPMPTLGYVPFPIEKLSAEAVEKPVNIAVVTQPNPV
jgi:hypothetical protein